MDVCVVCCTVRQKAKYKIIGQTITDKVHRENKIGILVEAKFSAPVQTGTGAHIMGTGLFPWVKRPRRSLNHPPPSSAEVKEKVELYLYSSSGTLCPIVGRTSPLPSYIFNKMFYPNYVYL
jgi:hypothetical protein